MSSAQPWTQWIDSAIVHDLYDDGIAKYGGLKSSSKDGCVDGALGAAYHAEILSMPEVDSETITSGLTFCGYLLFYIATKHCWVDGNKRAAWSAAMWVLFRLGLTVDARDEEVIAYCLQIASGEIKSGEDVANWIADRLAEVEA
jgi:death-on-curing protein